MVEETPKEAFSHLAGFVHRELVIANMYLTNLETLVKAAVDPVDQSVIDRYLEFFNAAIYAFVDGINIAMENCISAHPRGPSIRRAIVLLEQNADLASGLNVASLSGRLDDLANKLNKIVPWRHNWSAHRDLAATLPDVKIGEVRPLLEELMALFRDTCSIPAQSHFLIDLPDGDHAEQLIRRLTNGNGNGG